MRPEDQIDWVYEMKNQDRHKAEAARLSLLTQAIQDRYDRAEYVAKAMLLEDCIDITAPIGLESHIQAENCRPTILWKGMR